MLEFQKQILTELVEHDALLIMSPGLGLFKIFSSFLELYTKENHFVLVLNTDQAQDMAIIEKQTSLGLLRHERMQIVDAETHADTRCVCPTWSDFLSNFKGNRNAMYRKGGVFSVTSRILAVDLLLERVPTAMISGIVVYNAHR